VIELTPGQADDSPEAEPLLEAVLATATVADPNEDPRLGAVLGDKGYDSDALIAYIEALEAEAVIPSKKNRTTQREIDREFYKVNSTRTATKLSDSSAGSSITGGLPPATRRRPAITWLCFIWLGPWCGCCSGIRRKRELLICQ